MNKKISVSAKAVCCLLRTASVAVLAGQMVLPAHATDFIYNGFNAPANGAAINSATAVTVGDGTGVVTLSNNCAGYNASCGNVTGSANGGAIYSLSDVTLDGTFVTLSGNKATGSGGAIYAGGAVTIGVNAGNVAITDNSAAIGGAIYSGGAVLIGNDNASLLISANTSTAIYAAGDISLKGASITLSDNTSSLSTVGVDGSAIYSGSSLTIGANAGSVKITGNLFQNHILGGTISGGIYSRGPINIGNSSADIEISGNQTYSNYENNYVGTIVSSGNLTINGSSIKIVDNLITNNANRNAGVIASVGTAIIGNSASDVLIQRNTGGGNSAISAGDRAVINGRQVIISDNRGGNGSGVGASNSIIVTAPTTSLLNNIAMYQGAGLASWSSSVTVNGDLIATGNRAATAGAIVAGRYIVVDGNVTARDNRAVGLYGMGGSGGAFGFVEIEPVLTPDPLVPVRGLGGSGAVLHAAPRGLLGLPPIADGDIRLAPNSGNVSLTNNSAVMSGGAVFARNNALIGNANATLVMTGNAAGNTSYYADIYRSSLYQSVWYFGVGGGVVYAPNDVTLIGSSITVSGNSAVSIPGDMSVVTGGGAIFAGRNVTVTANGDATFSNNTASTEGGVIRAMGAVTLNANVGLTSFTGNSAGSKGGAIWVGGDVTLNATGGDITFSGNMHGDPVANAIWFDNTAGGATATFNANAGNVATFFDPIVNNAANGVMNVNKTGAGIVSFDGSLYSDETQRWSRMFANTTVSAGTFEVANDALYGALSTDATAPTASTSFTSAAGTMVQGGRVGTIIADNVTLNGDVSIAGRHTPTNDFSVLNLSTNKLTLGGGTFHFNTYLDQGTPGDSDLLVLNLHGSATSGQSFISVTNVGGAGALTVGNGIKLVEANGTGTTAGAFALNGRVAAGAYDYLLFHGGVGSDAGDENWYLRSTYTPPPTPDNPDPQPVPIVRPEVPVSMVIPPLAIEYGYAMLDTLHERVGETYLNDSGPATEERIVWCKDPKTNFRCVVRVPVANANGAGKDETRWAKSGWARLMGDRGLHNPDNFEKRGPNYDYTFGGIQAGLDIYAREQADGTLDKAGIYVGYGQITSNVKGQLGGKAGSVDMDAYTLAGYWTHHSPSGWYTDAVVQGTWYSADAKSIYNQQTKPDGFGILASLEGGYSFKLGSGWTLEPQAQIVYQNVSFGSTRDAYGFVRFDDGDSLRGRLGVRVTKSWNMADQGKEPRMVTAWLRANVWHEFLGKTKTSWGSLDGQNMTPFNTYLGGTWGEIGAGVTVQVTDKINIFATGAYNRSLDNKGREGWDGRLGMTVKW